MLGVASHEAPAPHEVEVVAQQTPSTHWLPEHSDGPEHGSPSPVSGTHVPVLQKFPEEQSLFVAHVVLHGPEPAAQTYAPQSIVFAEQLPLPSQVPDCVYDESCVALSVQALVPHAVVGDG